jgi:hypothetical protein
VIETLIMFTFISKDSEAEGLSKTLMDIKLTLENKQLETEKSPQIFPSHDLLSERVRKTCYYGKLPPTDRPSLPLTKLAVEQFSMVGLHKLSRLDITRAADMTRDACASPTSLVFSLIYLERLKRSCPEYLHNVSSADLFLVSMMVASKFLYDDGEEDEVFNDEWAKSGHMDVKDFNQLEVEFLSAINWNVNVPMPEFESALQHIEQEIAYREFTRRDWATYSDLCVLSANDKVASLWKLLSDTAIRMTTVCMAAYAASIFTLLGSTALLNQTPFGPEAVANSYQTLAGVRRNSQVVMEGNLSGHPVLSSDQTTTSQLGSALNGSSKFSDLTVVDNLTELNATQQQNLNHLKDIKNLNPAELLTASLLMASIKSSGEYNLDSGGQARRYSRRSMQDIDGEASFSNDTATTGTTDDQKCTNLHLPGCIMDKTVFKHYSTESRWSGKSVVSTLYDLVTSKLEGDDDDDKRVPDLHPTSLPLHLKEVQEDYQQTSFWSTFGNWNYMSDTRPSFQQCPLTNLLNLEIKSGVFVEQAAPISVF